MELLKSVFTNMDIHLDAPNRILAFFYGESYIKISLSSDNRVHLSTNLILAMPNKEDDSHQLKNDQNHPD